MGNATPRPSSQAAQTGPRQPSSAVKTIALALLALIVIVGLVVLITWLVLRPKKLQVSIDEASIHGYNLAGSKLNSTFYFTVRVYNPNKRVSVYHDTMEVSVAYQGQSLAAQVMSPFHQGHRNVTRLMAEAVARNVGMDGDRERSLKRERTGGAVELDVRMRGKLRFRVGRWKSRHYKLKVKCAPLVVFSDPKRFQPKKCDVDI